MKRRLFLKAASSTLLAAPFIKTSALETKKLRIAGIGVGGMGFANVNNVKDESIVALCDVDHTHATRAFEAYPEAKRWFDHREMFEKQPEIEAVIIGTPDHTHASIVKDALEAGKHVYCQKPLTHDIYESRRLASIAAEYPDLVAVMGNQYHSSMGAKYIYEWIHAGVIGEVKRVIAWCSLNYRPFGHAYWSTLLSRPPEDKPVIPDDLNWDLWMGPRSMRPYHPTYHPGRWRAWWDFGCGMMGDRGVHTLDSACWTLDLAAPTSINCLSIEGENEYIHPDKAHVRYEFPKRGKFPPLTLDWYSGSRPSEVDELTGGEPAGDKEGGALFIGSSGMISHGTYPNSPRLYPRELRKDAAEAPELLPAHKGTHEAVWVKACKKEGPISSDLQLAAKLTELTHLGNVAIKLGGKIEWDAKKAQVTNRNDAAGLIRRPRRSGWELE